MTRIRSVSVALTPWIIPAAVALMATVLALGAAANSGLFIRPAEAAVFTTTR